MLRPRIDGEADRRTAEPQRIVDAARHRLIARGRPAIRRIDLEDGRQLPRETVRPRLDHAERRGIGRHPRIERELVVIMRIVGVGIDRTTARRAVFETLIDRQDEGSEERRGGKAWESAWRYRWLSEL